MTKQDNKGSYVLIPLTEQIVEELKGDTNKSYYIQVHSPHYGMTAMSNPISFKAIKAAATKKLSQLTVDPTNEELKEADAAVQDLDNVKISGAMENNTGVNVEVTGSISASVSTDNQGYYSINDLNYEDGQNIQVNTEIDPASVTGKSMMAEMGLSGNDTSIEFDIDITKNYSGDSSVEMTDFSYPIEISFDMPEGSLSDGERYILLTKHNGKTRKIDFSIRNGKVYFYSSQFSSFAFVKVKDTEEIDKNTLSRTESSVKGTNTSGNSANTTKWNADFNITLQPKGTQKTLTDGTVQTSLGDGTYYDQNNVVWDGFGNKIGTFDASTGNVISVKKNTKPVQTVRKLVNSIIPDTGDRGVLEQAVSLAVSTAVAIGAFIVLKKY